MDFGVIILLGLVFLCLALELEVGERLDGSDDGQEVYVLVVAPLDVAFNDFLVLGLVLDTVVVEDLFEKFGCDLLSFADCAILYHEIVEIVF